MAVKIVAFFTLWLLLWLPIAIPLAIRWQWRPFRPSPIAQKLPLLAALYAVAPIGLGGFCWLEQTSFAQYGMPLSQSLFVALGWGFLAGSGGLAAVYYFQYRLGWLSRSESTAQINNPGDNGSKQSVELQAAAPSIEQAADQVISAQVVASSPPIGLLHRSQLVQMGLMLGLALWIGWTEELIFRGFLQSQLQQSLPLVGAASIASLIFAGLHGVWDGRAVMPQLFGLWLMGIVLVMAGWVAGGNLGLAWGLHAGWVWVLASLDNFQLQYTRRVPVWITGFNDQPLAGAVGLLFLLLMAIGLMTVGLA